MTDHADEYEITITAYPADDQPAVRETKRFATKAECLVFLAERSEVVKVSRKAVNLTRNRRAEA